MKYFYSSVFLLFSLIASAQESDLGNWLIYIGNTKLGDRWDVHSELQYRNYNFSGISNNS